MASHRSEIKFNRSFFIAFLASLMIAGCGGGGSEAPSQQTSAPITSSSSTTTPAASPNTPSSNSTPPLALSPAPAPTPAPTPIPAAPILPNDIAAWGDSLTPGYAAQLQTLFPSRTVFNGGVGGQISTQIAARQGGVIPLLTIAGNTIPTTGGVTVTAQTAYVHNNQGPGAVLGTLAGVHGSLTYDNVSTHTFTRTTAGDVTIVNPATPFIVDTFGQNTWINTFWYGRNNYTDPTQVKADIAASVAFLSAGNTRFIVMSVLNGGYGGYEIVGGAGYTFITQLNNDLKALYPQNYLDIRAYLVNQYNSAIPQDVIDFQNDLVPSSLRSDSIHLNTQGSLLVAKKVQEFIQAKGW